ncbi:hypothetical protein AVEN_147314-1 [Araneus ventricosus]|uniref:Uncharacterized protein n=1 Tax=Araneus ventricosus TaxID=182803 RepID=A0A4Y2KWU1_ARAVE|nr:hypothetical protein AVEN_147314-1 [Araneus ventricosus]
MRQWHTKTKHQRQWTAIHSYIPLKVLEPQHQQELSVCYDQSQYIANPVIDPDGRTDIIEPRSLSATRGAEHLAFRMPVIRCEHS